MTSLLTEPSNSNRNTKSFEIVYGQKCVYKNCYNESLYTSDSPKISENHEKDRTTDEVSSKPDQTADMRLASEVEMCNFVSSTSVLTESEPSINANSNNSERRHDVLQRLPSNTASQQNHLKPNHGQVLV